jgi:hypothetical protein
MLANAVKYPEVNVRLVGEDGMDDNAFAILGRVEKALRRADVSEDEVKAYHAEATSGDYEHLLGVTMQWVSTDEGNDDDGFDDDEEKP